MYIVESTALLSLPDAISNGKSTEFFNTIGAIADGPLLVPKEESERAIISVLAKAPLNGRSLHLYQLMDQGYIE